MAETVVRAGTRWRHKATGLTCEVVFDGIRAVKAVILEIEGGTLDRGADKFLADWEPIAGEARPFKLLPAKPGKVGGPKPKRPPGPVEPGGDL